MTLGLTHFLAVAAILFTLGVFTVVTRKNAVAVLMGVEIILNAANLNFVAFARYGAALNPLPGQIFPLFSIMIAAAEAAVGLAIVLAMFRNFRTVDTQEASTLRN